MPAPYDADNIFAKIIDGLIPANMITENDNALAFSDISPVTKFHALVIPKGAYQNFSQFNLRATVKEKKDFWDLVQETAHLLEAHYLEHADGEKIPGFRLITNQGPASGQEVGHFHVHILGGEKLGPLNKK